MGLSTLKKLKRKLFNLLKIERNKTFNSAEYWDNRYKASGSSGAGSYGHLAEFKANFLNEFVVKNGIKKVIEFGCGDGNQLRLSNYPRYIGFDVSLTSINMCKKLFANDVSKSFFLSSKESKINADLVLSLDVIYHLIEDEVYNSYMQQLFNSATNWVIIYSSNTNINAQGQSIHVRHRRFTDWIMINAPSFQFIQHVPNKYSLRDNNNNGSFADFFVFKKNSNT
jgi:hypothetical protein